MQHIATVGIQEMEDPLMTEIPRVLSFGRWWPDDDLEREIVTAAGFQFISRPAGFARPAAELEEAVREHQPSEIRVLRGESPRHPCNTPVVEVIA